MPRKQPQGGNQQKKQPSQSDKVGSDPQAAKNFARNTDFGVKESDTTERNYTSANTKASDPGAAQPRAGESEDRTAGVGGNASGVGSSSGGDIDTDIIGVGANGSGVAAPDFRTGPDDSDGSSNEFASGPPTKNYKGPKAGKVEGDTMDHSGGDIETTAEGRGADAASRPPRANPDQLDDSFAGEISTGEAAGQDSQ